MINDQIRDKEVRLIGANGEQIGVIGGNEAKRMAEEQDLDLVKISPNAKPPVCKIMDYSKYKFDQAKKAKEAKKKQKIVETKEIRLSPNIGSPSLPFSTNRLTDIQPGAESLLAYGIFII